MGHLKESAFVSSKRMRNLFEGIREGIVSPVDLSAEDLTGIQPYVVADMKAHAQLVNPAPPRPPRTISLAGRLIWIDKRLVISDADLRRAGLNRCTDASVADIFAVPDLSSMAMGQRISWQAGLNGCVVATQEFICSAGASGAATVYKQATVTKRALWMSDNFVASHAVLAAIVAAAADRGGSNWTRFHSRANFVARATALAGRAPTQCLALVNVNEKSDEDTHVCNT